jgi:hypothetical protein
VCESAATPQAAGAKITTASIMRATEAGSSVRFVLLQGSRRLLR